MSSTPGDDASLLNELQPYCASGGKQAVDVGIYDMAGRRVRRPASGT